jgi:hypothetical protein
MIGSFPSIRSRPQTRPHGMSVEWHGLYEFEYSHSILGEKPERAFALMQRNSNYLVVINGRVL